MANRKTGEEVAEMLSDFVNVAFGDERVKFVDTVIREHRTLQQDMFKLMFGCIQEWALFYQNDNYDDRNAWTCMISNEIMENLKDKNLY